MIRKLILTLGIVALAVVPAQTRDEHGFQGRGFHGQEFRGHAFHSHREHGHGHGRFGFFGGFYAFAPQQYWYYCQYPPGYYPYVLACPEGWEVISTP